MKTKIEFTQTDAKRPLIHIPNRPDIYVYPYSECFVGETHYGNTKYFWIDEERYFYASNLISYCEYGLITGPERTQWITDMLNGHHLTPLEINMRNDKIIAEHLPKRDLWLAKYQFSNSVRPTECWVYKNGKYHRVWQDGVSDHGKAPVEFAWYMNRNVMVVLPEGVTDCDSSLFNKLNTEKDNLIEANKYRITAQETTLTG